MQTTPKANNILGHFFALLGAVVMLAIATWVSASSSQQVEPLDNMVTARTGHTATALADGRIMITGGRDADGHLVAASEIFDPESQVSSASASLHTARIDHTATVLADGRVLVTGGSDANGNSLSSAEIFDPANPNAGFQVVQQSMTAARTRHTATLLNNGSVLIAGGEATATAEIFDPAAQTFSPTIWPLTMARSGHTATLFADDSVLLAGGNTNSMETFTLADQKFTIDPATMSVVRTGHWAFELSDTRLLLFQGDTGNTVDEFNPGTGTITPKGSLDFHASSSSLLANGKVLVLGTNVSGLYDPDAVPPAPDFTQFDETGVPHSSTLPRSGQSSTQLPGDKKILIAGGANAQNIFQGMALFNPARIWTDRDDYEPGDPVVLSGSGWKANEDVYLYVVDNVNQGWSYGATETAGADGSFVDNPYFIVQQIQVGAQFHVTAVGAQSNMQADVDFTDSVTSVTIVSVNGVPKGNPLPLVTFTTLPQTLTVVFNYVTSPTGTTTADLDFNGPVTLTNNGVSIPPGTQNGQVITLNIPSGTTNGTYNVKVTVHNSTGGGANNGNDSVNNSVVINVPTCTAPSITAQPSSQTVPYGTASVSFTATASGSPAPTVQWQSSTNGGGSWNDLGGQTNTTLTISNPTVASPAVQYRAVFTNQCNGTQTATTTAATLTVTPKNATVTADNATKVYGDANPIFTATVTGTINGDTLNYTLASTATQFSNVGTYSITVTLGSNPNYSVTKTDGTLTINQKNATITANNKTKTYGDANPTLTATVTGQVTGGDSINYTLATAATQFSNVGPYPITVTLGSNPNYSVTKTDGTLTINPAVASVTANDKSKTYGQANPAFDAVVVGEVTGGDTINYTLSTTATQFSNVGSYEITVNLASNPNYTVTPHNGTLAINPAIASVTANDKNKAYGQANPVFDAVVVGEVTGGDPISYTLTTTATQFSNVSTYAIVVNLGSNPNYTVTPHNGILTINPAVATVTANDKTKTYGQANPTLDATVVGEVTGGDPINYTLATTATQFSNVGTYPIAVTLGSNPNYTVTPTDGTLTVDPAVASVTANDKSKTYGQANPAFDAVVVGEVTGGDPINYTLSTTATQFSNVGTYAITVNLGSNPNYTVTPHNGTLTINPAIASVTANDKSKTYGQANPAFDAIVVGEVVGGDTINYTLSTTATQFSNVGTYAIVVNLGSNPNYTVTPHNGTLAINPAIASVTANDKSKTYGQANPAFDAVVVGEVTGGDTISYTLSTTATQFSNVGTYAIVVNLGSNPNYTVTPHNGTLTINQAVASVTANDKSKTYGQANPALDATVVGQVTGGDPINYTLATTAIQCSAVGTYAITVTLGSNPNYSVTPTNGTLTITKAHLTVTADDKSAAYTGSAFTAFTVSFNGFVCGDTSAVVSGSASFTTNPAGATLPGTYTIIPAQGTLNASNYDFTPFNNGTLTIGYGSCTGGYVSGQIQQPINADGSSVFKKGSTVPVKFTVCDATGNPISNAAAVFAADYGSVQMLTYSRGTVEGVNESTYTDIPDSAFRWSTDKWIFNMATGNLTQGTYTFRIILKGPLAPPNSYVQFTLGIR